MRTRSIYVAAAVALAAVTAYVATPSVAQQSQPGAAQQNRAVGTLTTKDISLAQAQRIVEAAVNDAYGRGLAMNVAVVDAGGNLKAFARMENAWLGSIDIAIKKAKTARYFDMPTGEVGKLSQPGGPLYNIEVSNGGLITFPGGIPIKDAGGAIIGAIGVSGSTVDNDHAVAEAGLKSMK